MPDAPRHLLEAALKVRENAYAPYSKFSVGAAVETTDGSVFLGTNMENVSYGLSMCAEVGALQAATAAGKHDRLLRIAIVGSSAITPCGRCRQLIYEASQRSGVDIEVWCSDTTLTAIERHEISELLPHAFSF